MPEHQPSCSLSRLGFLNGVPYANEIPSDRCARSPQNRKISAQTGASAFRKIWKTLKRKEIHSAVIERP
jgi:hypothetical protein